MGDLVKYKEYLMKIVAAIDELIYLESMSVGSDDPRYLAELGRLVMLQGEIKNL